MARRTASALSYRPEDGAPKVVAQGRGPAADRLLQLAEDAGVRIVEDATLAALLDLTPIGTTIPELCWEAAARILAFVLDAESVQSVAAHR